MILEKVENQILYHIQQGPVPPGGHTWEIRKKDYWGKETNFVMKSAFNLLGEQLIDQLTNEPIDSFGAYQEMYAELLRQMNSPEYSQFISANIDLLLSLYLNMFSTFNNHLYVLREYIFEEVRKEVNPELPSRFTGLWITPEEDLDFWWHALSPQEINTIIKLKLNGKIFKGHSYWQPKLTLSVAQWKEVALQYWNSSLGFEPYGRFEYLFEGESEVIDVMKPEDFGLRNPKTINGCPILGTY